MKTKLGKKNRILSLIHDHDRLPNHNLLIQTDKKSNFSKTKYNTET